MPKQEKILMMEKVKEEIKSSNGLVVADFKGLTVLEMETLRKMIAKEGGETKVLKNSILEKAFEAADIKGMSPYLKNNTVLFSSKTDIMSLLKLLANYSKDNEKFVIKAGYIDGVTFEKESVIAMSKMPSRKELLSMIAGNVNSVISSFVGTLNGIMASFTGTIEALEKKKGQ